MCAGRHATSARSSASSPTRRGPSSWQSCPRCGQLPFSCMMCTVTTSLCRTTSRVRCRREAAVQKYCFGACGTCGWYHTSSFLPTSRLAVIKDQLHLKVATIPHMCASSLRMLMVYSCTNPKPTYLNPGPQGGEQAARGDDRCSRRRGQQGEAELPVGRPGLSAAGNQTRLGLSAPPQCQTPLLRHHACHHTLQSIFLNNKPLCIATVLRADASRALSEARAWQVLHLCVLV